MAIKVKTFETNGLLALLILPLFILLIAALLIFAGIVIIIVLPIVFILMIAFLVYYSFKMRGISKGFKKGRNK